MTKVLELHYRNGGELYVPEGKLIRFEPAAKGTHIFTHGDTHRDPYTGQYTLRPILVRESCEDIADMLDPRRAFAKRPALGETLPAFVVRDFLEE